MKKKIIHHRKKLFDITLGKKFSILNFFSLKFKKVKKINIENKNYVGIVTKL